MPSEPELERVIQETTGRLSTIRSADVIFVLQHGRVAEQGTHRELMRAGNTLRV